MSSGQHSPASSHVEERPTIIPQPMHARGPARFARKPSFAVVKREEIIKREQPHDGDDGEQAPVRDEDAHLLLSLQVASPVAAHPTLPTAPSRLAISSLVNPHDVPVSAQTSPLSAPPQTTRFGSPPIRPMRARSDSPGSLPALNPPAPPRIHAQEGPGAHPSRSATRSMSISVEPEDSPARFQMREAPPGSKPRLPRIPKKNGSSSTSLAKNSSASSPHKTVSSSPGKAASTPRAPSSPAKSASTSSPNKSLGSPEKSTLASSPAKSAPSPGKPTVLTTRKLLASSPSSSSPLKPRGRVSKGPKKREGPGWIIESCTTSGCASDDEQRPTSPPSQAIIAAKLQNLRKDVFGGDSDLSDLSSSDEEEEEEYDPGLAGLPALPVSSESEYEPLARRNADEPVTSRRRSRSGVNFSGAFA